MLGSILGSPYLRLETNTKYAPKSPNVVTRDWGLEVGA